MQQGRTDEAETCFAQADALGAGRPENARPLVEAARSARRSGARAGELLDRAEAASSAKDVDLLRASYLARCGQARRSARPHRRGARAQRRRPARTRPPARSARPLRRSVAQTSSKANANSQQRPAVSNTRADAVEAFFARLKQFFTRERSRSCRARRCARTCRSRSSSWAFRAPAPRSSSRFSPATRRCAPGGELPFISELRQLALNAAARPTSRSPRTSRKAATADNRYAATLFRDYYFARAEQYGLLSGRRRHRNAFFTDKMPFNEIWLPLLRMAFPEAKIVHVLRHPLDVCVSMMSNNFTHGFNCGYRIEDIVHHLAAVSDLDGALPHAARARGSSRLRYESLVADQERETRRLLDSSRPAVRGRLPALSREPPLRADAELRAGDREAQRPLDRPASALRGAAAAVSAAARAALIAAGGYRSRRPRPSELEAHAHEVDATVVVDRARPELLARELLDLLVR